MKAEPVIFPKTTPRWLIDRVRYMESEIINLNKKYERVSNQLWKNQEDFQDLLNLVERIAEDREPWIRIECQKMVERFNPGSYSQEEEVP
jgi:hypothetical protein